jgi:hypothetical protein
LVQSTHDGLTNIAGAPSNSGSSTKGVIMQMGNFSAHRYAAKYDKHKITIKPIRSRAGVDGDGFVSPDQHIANFCFESMSNWMRGITINNICG